MESTKNEKPTVTGYLTVREVAACLRASPASVRAWVRAGKLGSVRPGRRILVPVEALENLGPARQGEE